MLKKTFSASIFS